MTKSSFGQTMPDDEDLSTGIVASAERAGYPESGDARQPR
jgi:hypothetical protein